MNPERRISSAIRGLGLGSLGEALAGVDAYVVGGTARALVAGERPDGDIDIAFEADVEPLLAGLAGLAVVGRHERFDTATVRIEDGRLVDLARTRTEVYERPGALPVVSPAPIGADLARRDFTVNAIAIGLNPPQRVLDPFGGAEDLPARRLRVLHPGSFRDDPTRAIRAARYCARLELSPDEETRRLLEDADLGLVSSDRRTDELARLAAEPSAAEGFALLSGWGVLTLPKGALELVGSVDEALRDPAVRILESHRDVAILLAATSEEAVAVAEGLAAEQPERPSQAVASATGIAPAILLLAAASGGLWIRRYLSEWRTVNLEIDGNDLIAAGLSPGPALGAALRGALELKLDGRLEPGRDRELDAALEIARTRD